jgi:hypothetical protein
MPIRILEQHHRYCSIAAGCAVDTATWKTKNTLKMEEGARTIIADVMPRVQPASLTLRGVVSRLSDRPPSASQSSRADAARLRSFTAGGTLDRLPTRGFYTLAEKQDFAGLTQSFKMSGRQGPRKSQKDDKKFEEQKLRMLERAEKNLAKVLHAHTCTHTHRTLTYPHNAPPPTHEMGARYKFVSLCIRIVVLQLSLHLREQVREHCRTCKPSAFLISHNRKCLSNSYHMPNTYIKKI